jgi:hypothetical protein
MTDLTINKGYWQANGKQFDVKVNAILEAQSTDSEVTFHYNDQIWDQLDWTVEPKQSLEELYLHRAQQLRDKYKTLILRFSGGADSMNILRTFVDNNIKIDVITVNEYTHLTNSDRQTHPGSIEKQQVALPFLDQLQAQGVEFERLELDISEWFLLIGQTPDWIFKINCPRFHIYEIAAPRTVLHAALKKYDSPDTAVITGLDKPWLHCHHDKIWTCHVPDIFPVMATPGFNQMSIEPFYWTADLPALPCKQAHVIKNWCKKTGPRSVSLMRNKQHVIPLLYPKYFKFNPGDLLPYVNLSHSNGPRCGIVDAEIEKMPIFGAWRQGIDLADQLIDRRFKNLDSIWQDNLKIILSKHRWLGR